MAVSQASNWEQKTAFGAPDKRIRRHLMCWIDYLTTRRYWRTDRNPAARLATGRSEFELGVGDGGFERVDGFNGWHLYGHLLMVQSARGRGFFEGGGNVTARRNTSLD